MKILLASNNRHKLKEIKQIFDEFIPGKMEIVIPNDIMDEAFEVEENGDTLEENARLKAQAFFEATGIPCIADDTGLEIDLLNGEPGVKSARYSGVHGDDAANRKKVLDLLDGSGLESRTARFRTSICYIDSARTEYADGICEGKILFEERGEGGFGYDSLFMPDGFDKTFAEMSEDEKNSISHRGNAVKNFVKLIQKIYSL